MDGPHSLGFSPDTRCITSTNCFASERRAGSLSPPMYALTLTLVGLVLFSGILASLAIRKASTGAHRSSPNESGEIAIRLIPATDKPAETRSGVELNNPA